MKPAEYTRNRIKPTVEVSLLDMSLDANKGDLAIAESTLSLIRNALPGAAVSLFNHDYTTKEVEGDGAFFFVKQAGFSRLLGSPFPRVHRGGHFLRENLEMAVNLIRSFWALGLIRLFKHRGIGLLPPDYREIVRQIDRSRLVVLKGGSYFYSYGGPKQLLFLYRMFLLSLLAVFLDKRVIALGHSIGPVKGRTARRLARSCLKRFYRIVAREEITREFLCREMGIDPQRIELLPDAAFLDIPPAPPSPARRPPDGEPGPEELERIPSPRIGLTVRNWNFPGQSRPRQLFQQYLSAVAAFVDRVADEIGATCVFMPHAQEDIPVMEEVLSRVRKSRPLLLRGDYHPHELRRLYGAMDLFIATRIHSGIFALTAGTPVLAIAYEAPKGYGIIGMIEGKEYVLDIKQVTADDLLLRSRAILAESARLKKVISEKVGAAAESLLRAVPRLLEDSLSP